MAKATEKTTIIGIVVATTAIEHRGGYVERIATLTREHDVELHEAVAEKLRTAGYSVTIEKSIFGPRTIEVRRTADAQPFVAVKRIEQQRSHFGGHTGTDGYAVANRRYTFSRLLDQSQEVAWTYSFQMNWQKFLGAIEEELAHAEREYQWKHERELVDAMADRLRRQLLGPVGRLALFSDAKRVIVETQQSTAEPPLFALRVEFSERHAVTSADLLPFLQRFPDAVPETVYKGVLLKSMTFDQIMAAVASLPVPA